MVFKVHDKTFACFTGHRRPVFLWLPALLLAALISLCPVGPAFAAATFDNTGAGTAGSPYQISTAAHLAELASLVNNGTDSYPTAHYILTRDVNAGAWTPIGTAANPFRGRFDGNGYKIINPKFIGNANHAYIGLFGKVSGGVISNLGVEGGAFSGKDYVGGIAGYLGGSVVNCYYKGGVSGAATIGSSSATGGAYHGGVGGIAGTLAGSISRSYSTASVTRPTGSLGGIAGELLGGSVISNCYSTGNVTDTRSVGDITHGSVGGIAGLMSGSKCLVTNCYSTGAVSGWSWVGGIAGDIALKGGVTNSVALNPGVARNASAYEGVTSDRVFGYDPGNAKSWNNYARSDMTAGAGSKRFISAGYDPEEDGAPPAGMGADTTMTEAKTVTFWTEKAKWDEDIWNFAEGNLPTLNMTVETVVVEEPVAYFAGKGTETEPYLIGTPANLAKLAELVNDDDPVTREIYRDKHYELTANISLADYPADKDGGWVPIGQNRAYSFRGTFDGGGHSVTNLAISRKTQDEGGDYEGLFGYVYTGTVKNLTVRGSVEGWTETGGVAGYLEGDGTPGSARIENCVSSVSVKCWGPFAGGIVGYVWNGGAVEKCGSSGEVLGQNDDVGGIAGMLKSESSVRNSYSTGKVCSPANRVAGIAGALEADSSVENSYSAGEISGANRIGGIAGYVTSGSSVRNSYSTGAVFGLAGDVYLDGTTMSTGGPVDSGLGGQTVYVVLGDYVGGVAGEVFYGSVTNSYSAGPVWGHKEVGGVVGTLNGNYALENSVAFGPSVRASDQKAGRVVGVVYGDGVLDDIYAYSDMTNSEGAPFTGVAGTDATVEQAKTSAFWEAIFGTGEESAWTYEDGYLPLLKDVKNASEKQTKKVPGVYDEEVIDAKTGATSKHESSEGGNEGGTNNNNSNNTGNNNNNNTSDTGGAANTGSSSGGGSANTGGSAAPDGSETTPSDTNASTDTPITPGAGRQVFIDDGESLISVPENSAIDEATGAITVTDGGAVTLADGETVIVVPPATTIDPESGIMTVTSPEGESVALSVSLGGEDDIEISVPSGSEIDLNTGVITLPDGGTIVFSGDGAAGRRAGSESGLAYVVTPGTTISSATGVITVTNGGDVTLPDGSTVTVAPGTTIEAFTGRISQPGGANAGVPGSGTAGSGGGCDTGLAGLAVAATALCAGAVSRKKTR